MFALGYCITNCSSQSPFWNVECSFSIELLQGLTTKKRSDAEYGVIKKLHLHADSYLDRQSTEAAFMTMQSCVTELVTPLNTIAYLIIEDDELYCKENTTLFHLSELIPHLTSVQKLQIIADQCRELDEQDAVIEDSLLLLFQQLSHSKVTSLYINGTDIQYFLNKSARIAFALCVLIHPQSGTLLELISARRFGNQVMNVDNFTGLVSSPSSLQHLSLSESTLTTFNTNNNLTKLTIICSRWSAIIKDVIRILNQSQKLKHLHLGHFNLFDDINKLQAIATALEGNSTLQTLKLSYWRTHYFHSSPNRGDKYKEVIVAIQEIDNRADLLRCMLRQGRIYQQIHL